MRRLEPAIFEAVKEAYDDLTKDLNFLRLGAKAFAQSPATSVDYGVMEKTDRAAVLPVDYIWSDVGSWDAVVQVMARDDHDNSVVGDVTLVGSRNNLAHLKDRLATLIGVENIVVVVSTRDSLLIVQKKRSEEVKKLVSQLQDDGRIEANEALQMFRPWGNYERRDRRWLPGQTDHRQTGWGSFIAEAPPSCRTLGCGPGAGRSYDR